MFIAINYFFEHSICSDSEGASENSEKSAPGILGRVFHKYLFSCADLDSAYLHKLLFSIYFKRQHCVCVCV